MGKSDSVNGKIPIKRIVTLVVLRSKHLPNVIRNWHIKAEYVSSMNYLRNLWRNEKVLPDMYIFFMQYCIWRFIQHLYSVLTHVYVNAFFGHVPWYPGNHATKRPKLCQIICTAIINVSLRIVLIFMIYVWPYRDRQNCVLVVV